MASDFSLTRDEIIQRAFERIGVTAVGVALTNGCAEEKLGEDLLGVLLRELSDSIPLPWKVNDSVTTLTLTPGTTSYLCNGGPGNPPGDIHRIVSATYYDGTSEDVVEVSSILSYEFIATKPAQGVVEKIYLSMNPQYDARKLYVYPTGSGTCSLKFYYESPISDFDADTYVSDLPEGWTRYLINKLAAEIAPYYGLSAEMIALHEKVASDSFTMLTQGLGGR